MRTTCLTAGLSLTALFCSVSAYAADPRLLNLVMPDATTVAGANVTNAEISPFGQYILTQLTATAGNEIQTLVTATGFDPRHDVSEILAASSGNVKTPAGLMLALGNFQVSQITSAIATKAPSLTVQTYGGATLITNNSPKSSSSLAFLGATIAIAGDTPSVKAAIDRSAAANSINPALAAQVLALSTTQDAWAVTSSSVATLIPGLGAASPAATSSPLPQIAQMFNGIQGSSGGIKFGSLVQISGQALTTDAATAKSLADVIQALVSIASMAGGQDPQVASMAQLLQGLKVTADGATINLALSIPETQIETIINGMKNQAKPGARPAIRPAMVAPRAPASAVAVAKNAN
jgi:hypothetical protein